MKTVQEMQDIRSEISDGWFGEISDGIIQNHPNGLTSNHILAQSLQEYLKLVRNARHQDLIEDQYDEPWGRRVGFKRYDGKIISIHLQTLKDSSYVFSSPAETMVSPEGRRIILGLEENNDEGLVVDVDVKGELPCPEGYEGMPEVAHYGESLVNYEDVEVEKLDHLFPVGPPAVLVKVVPMVTDTKCIKVTFNKKG